MDTLHFEMACNEDFGPRQVAAPMLMADVGPPLPDALPSEPMGASLPWGDPLPSRGIDLRTVSASEQFQNRLKIPSDLRLDRGSRHPAVQSCAPRSRALAPLLRTQPLPFHRLSRERSAGIAIAQDIN